MKKIKDFKSSIDMKPCCACEKPFEKLCSIKIVTTNCTKCYSKSKRPWRNHYSLKLCPTCFKKFEEKVVNIVI